MMNLYSLHVHVAVQGGPLLGAPLVGIRILHFTDLNRYKTKIFFKKLKYAITKSTTTNSNGQVFQVHHRQDKNSNIFNKKKDF